MSEFVTQPPLVLRDLGNPVPQILAFPCHDCWPNPTRVPQFLSRSYRGGRPSKARGDGTEISRLPDLCR